MLPEPLSRSSKRCSKIMHVSVKMPPGQHHKPLWFQRPLIGSQGFIRNRQMIAGRHYHHEGRRATHTRAKSRLFAVGGQNRARRGLTAGGNWIRNFSSAMRSHRRQRDRGVTPPDPGGEWRLLGLPPDNSIGVPRPATARMTGAPVDRPQLGRTQRNRCLPSAELNVRIHSPPAVSQQTFGSSQDDARCWSA